MTTPPSEPTADLDRLLTAFYQSELPKPWPRPRYPSLAHASPAPAASSPGTPRRAGHGHAHALSQGKFALAVSVALLLGSCWYLSGLPVADWTHPAAHQREAVNPFDLSASQRLLDQQLQRPGSQPAPNAPAMPQVDWLNLHQLGGTGLPKNDPPR